MESSIDILPQGLLDGWAALGRVEPGAAAKVELVGLNERQDVVEVIVTQAIGGGKLRNLALEAVDALGIFQVEVGHLHVGSALARVAGRDVVLELEVNRLKGHQGDDGGHLRRSVDPVVVHGLGNEGSSLLSSAAFGSISAVLGVRSNLLDDGSSGQLGRGEGGEAQDERGDGGEMHGDDELYWYHNFEMRK